jgi:hypothetical protein
MDSIDLVSDDEGEGEDQDSAKDDDEQDCEEEHSDNPLAELDDDTREQLLKGTAAVRTTLNKVCCDIMFDATSSDLYIRSVNYPLQSFTQVLSHSLHGVRLVPHMGSASA